MARAATSAALDPWWSLWAVGDGVCGDGAASHRAQDPPGAVPRGGVDDHRADEVDVERVTRTAGNEVEIGGELMHAKPYGGVWRSRCQYGGVW
jgi:hypothetical protein